MSTFKRTTSWLTILALTASAWLPGTMGVDNWLCIGLDGHVGFNGELDNCHVQVGEDETCSSECGCGHEEPQENVPVVDVQGTGKGHHDRCIDLPLVSNKHSWLTTIYSVPVFVAVPAVYTIGTVPQNTGMHIDVPLKRIDPGGYLSTVVLIL